MLIHVRKCDTIAQIEVPVVCATRGGGSVILGGDLETAERFVLKYRRIVVVRSRGPLQHCVGFR